MKRPLQEQIGIWSRVQWAMGIIVLVGAAAFYLLAYRPAAQRLAAANLDIDTKQRALAQSREKARDLPILDREVKDLQKQVHARGKLFPRQPDLGPFIRDLTGISRQLALRDWKYEHGLPKRGKAYYELPIDMKFESDFVSLASFLKHVEGFERMTRVQRLTVKSKDTVRGDVTVQMAMNIYFAEE